MSDEAMMRETSAVRRILSAIDDFFADFGRRLNSVQISGERKLLEAMADRYHASRDETYFGTFRRHNSEEYVRVSRHGAIHDGNAEVVTVNYFADEAQDYALDPGPTSRTAYKAQVRIQDGKIIEIVEEGDTRIADPRRVQKGRRTGELTDIMETVRRDQDELVRVDVNENVLITGGPGTGKTAVGLQRLGFVMYDDRGRLGQRRILVLGPSPAYRRYVSNFLPRLGFKDVIVRSYREFLAEPLADATDNKTINIYEDSRGAVRDKNSKGLERALLTAIWPANRVGGVSVRVLDERRSQPELRMISKEDVQAIHDSLRESFWAQEISYERARDELHRQLISRLRRESADLGPASTPEGRRDSLVRSLPEKIGRHSREARRLFEREIGSRQGRNLERDLLGLLQAYYVADITTALDLVIEANAPRFALADVNSANLSPSEGVDTVEVNTGSTGLTLMDLISRKAIEDKLKELDVAPKREVNPGRRLFARQERFDIGQFRLSEMTLDRNTAFGREVWEFVRSILPNRNAVRIARDIALGRSQVFKEIGVKQIEQLGTRLRGYAKSTVKDESGTEDWSSADLALMYWCNSLVNGTPARFAHVLLDEAQDLTGLELKALSSAIGDAPITVAGDLKQSTTFGALPEWSALMDGLGKSTFTRGDLTVNYRVPAAVYTYALSYVADMRDVTDVTSSLEGGEVSLVITDDRRDTLKAVDDLLGRLGSDVLVGVLGSPREIEDLGLPETNDLLVTTPFEAKGLEVDHLVLVEPTSWFDQSREMRRLMFVALTRATKSVTILQSKRASGRIVDPDA